MEAVLCAEAESNMPVDPRSSRITFTASSSFSTCRDCRDGPDECSKVCKRIKNCGQERKR